MTSSTAVREKKRSLNKFPLICIMPGAIIRKLVTTFYRQQMMWIPGLIITTL
jgi:hypothetical protein